MDDREREWRVLHARLEYDGDDLRIRGGVRGGAAAAGGEQRRAGGAARTRRARMQPIGETAATAPIALIGSSWRSSNTSALPAKPT